MLALSSPLVSSKSKTWVGLRKSSAISERDGLRTGVEGSAVTSEIWARLVVTGGVAVCLGALEIGRVVDALADLVDLTLTTLTFVDLVVCGLLAAEVGVALEERRGLSPSIDLFLSIVYNYSMKARKLTKKQLALLDFLQDFTEENGYSPSYREIMSGMGLTSVSAVAEHVENLVKKGVLKKVPGAARSLEILDYKHESTVELFRMCMLDCTEDEKNTLNSAARILGIEIEQES